MIFTISFNKFLNINFNLDDEYVLLEHMENAQMGKILYIDNILSRFVLFSWSKEKMHSE